MLTSLMLTYQKGCGERNGREFVGGEKRMRDKKIGPYKFSHLTKIFELWPIRIL